jgi:hypothetical protein
MCSIRKSESFFKFSTDNAVTAFSLTGFESLTVQLFDEIETELFEASEERRFFCVFRFLRIEYEWATQWRKSSNENWVGLDLVFLDDAFLPFYDAQFKDLSRGIQRLIIGLTTFDTFTLVLKDKQKLFEKWGHHVDNIIEKLKVWFISNGYLNIHNLFTMFDRDMGFYECESAIPWLSSEDIVFLYEKHIANQSLFFTNFDSNAYFMSIGKLAKNRKKKS